MFKGALVGLVHQKALTGQGHAYDDGKALTLISTDVSGVEGAAEMLHEMWAFCLEGVVGFSMLATEIGWLWPLPAGIVLCWSFRENIARCCCTMQANSFDSVLPDKPSSGETHEN